MPFRQQGEVVLEGAQALVQSLSIFKKTRPREVIRVDDELALRFQLAVVQ